MLSRDSNLAISREPRLWKIRSHLHLSGRLRLIRFDELLFYGQFFPTFGCIRFLDDALAYPDLAFGVGVTLGLTLLVLALLIFWLLSKIPYFENAYRRGLEPHIIALTAALALGVGITYYYRELFQPVSGDFRSDEMALVAIALSLLLGLFTWSLFFCSNKRFLEKYGLYCLKDR